MVVALVVVAIATAVNVVVVDRCGGDGGVGGGGDV